MIPSQKTEETNQACTPSVQPDEEPSSTSSRSGPQTPYIFDATISDKDAAEQIGKMFDDSEPFVIHDLDKKEDHPVLRAHLEAPPKLERFDEKTEVFDEKLDKYVESKETDQNSPNSLQPDLPTESLDERIDRYLESKSKNEKTSFNEKLDQCLEAAEKSKNLPPSDETTPPKIDQSTQTIISVDKNSETESLEYTSANENTEHSDASTLIDDSEENMEVEDQKDDQIIDEETIEKTISQIQEKPQEQETQATSAALNLMTTEVLSESEDEVVPFSGNDIH
ncbi:bifunctional lysine-specific demethylase and histidyl-hydroxylase NO66-like [Planococcus citri]|uniref:bifunctional lysine-specific demethylase and histidyl-hydroxylase NO66-like n=1 Tax=Planococcus citri TaxID=170843 RepID=UPI0031F9433D